MIDKLEKMLREHSDAGLASEMITAHYPKTRHQEDECQICATVFRIATAALSQHEQRTAPAKSVLNAIDHLLKTAESYEGLTTPDHQTVSDESAKLHTKLAAEFKAAAEILRQFHNKKFNDGFLAAIETWVEQRTAAQQVSRSSEIDDTQAESSKALADAAAPMSEERHVANITESHVLASTGSSDAGVAPGLGDVPPTPTPGSETRQRGHSALRAVDGKIEVFDPHPKSVQAPTPETDQLYLNIQQSDDDVAFNTMHDHAKTLERQRDEARRELAAESRSREETANQLAATLQRAEKALAALALVQQDCRNLIEKVIPNIKERHQSDLAALQKRLDEAGKKLKVVGWSVDCNGVFCCNTYPYKTLANDIRVRRNNLYPNDTREVRALCYHDEATAQIARLKDMQCRHGWRGFPPKDGESIQTPCPECGAKSLFIGDGGHLTCARVPSDASNGCPNPDVADVVQKLKAQIAALQWALDSANAHNPLEDEVVALRAKVEELQKAALRKEFQAAIDAAKGAGNGS